MSEKVNNNGEIELFKLQAELCKSLSDPKRLRALLRKTGIIDSRRQGTVVYYRLFDSTIADACHMVREVLSEQFQRYRRLPKLL